jgi:hypothetical protein
MIMTHSAGPAGSGASAAAASGKPVTAIDAVSQVANLLGAANKNKLTLTQLKMVGKQVIRMATPKSQTLSKLDDKVKESMKGYEERVQKGNLGGRTAAWVGDTFDMIDKWSRFQGKVCDTIAGQLDKIKGVELLNYTDHGAAAIADCLADVKTLRTMNGAVAGKRKEIWGIIAATASSSNDVGTLTFVQAVELHSETLICAAGLELKVEELRALAEATLDSADSLVQGMEARLVDALDFEVQKAVKTANPSLVQQRIERAQQVVEQVGGGASFVATVGVPLGSAGKLLDSGKSLCDVFSHFVGRAIKSYYTGAAVREDMIDPKKRDAALQFLDNQPLRVAEYLKEKYIQNIDGYIKLINLTQDVVMTAINAGIEAATHGAGAPVTKIVGTVVDGVTDIIKDAVRSFFLAVQEERIKAAETLLQQAQAQNLGLGAAANQAAANSTSFFADYLKQAPGRIKEHVMENSKSGLLALLTPAGLAAEGISAFLDSLISLCVQRLDIQPAQIFTKATFEEVVKDASPEVWRHMTAATAGGARGLRG